MVIWKFPVPICEEPIEVLIPLSSKVLTIQQQHQCGGIEEVIWVLLDETQIIIKPRKFRWFVTGQITDDLINTKYIGTLQDYTSLVYHLFELI